jgi:DNA-binding transcriptional MerR regulator
MTAMSVPESSTEDSSRGEHRSIGDVLALLQQEFADISISKIRFLESQGLINPERTPSGYRRFYETDVERLRWILAQQRDHFLPLKVIKDRLDGRDTDGLLDLTGSVPAVPPPRSHTTAGSAVPVASPPEVVEAATLTLVELCGESGLSGEEVKQLEAFGLIAPRKTTASTLYDLDALAVAKLAARFYSHGVEARHLRMFKVAVDREMGVFEAVTLPMLRQRASASRRRALDGVAEMARLAEGMHAALMRRSASEFIERA